MQLFSGEQVFKEQWMMHTLDDASFGIDLCIRLRSSWVEPSILVMKWCGHVRDVTGVL